MVQPNTSTGVAPNTAEQHTSSQVPQQSVETSTHDKSKALRIGLIVGETSGAIIALGMIKQIKKLYPNSIVEGIGSQALADQGMHCLFDMRELSVMGLVEVLKHLPRLLRIRKSIVEHFLANPPDVFIGVDAPDFNLRVETALKKVGIPTVHYVSPTVWAWREKRIHKIGRATNLVLGVFPFEKEIYQKYNLPFEFVGHTMADAIALDVDQQQARRNLGLISNKELTAPDNAPQEYLALLPGSRAREISSLLDIFLQTFVQLKKYKPYLKVIIPAVDDPRKSQIEDIIAHNDYLNSVPSYKQDIVITLQPAREVMIASDIILLASGTAALEAMLCKRPMVVAYKMSNLTYLMMKRLYKPAYFALPNILANELLVPEFLQEQVNPSNLTDHLLKQWQQHSTEANSMLTKFREIHKTLGVGADKAAAKAVLNLIGK